MRSNLFTRSRFIFPVNKGVKKQNLGEKSSGLVDLMRLGLNVPKTYACSWLAYQQYANGDDSVFEKILSELNEILTRKKKYAVRSSSNSEDTDLYSFAGQFESVLNVESPEKAVTAIRSIWDQIRSDELQFYLKEHHLTADGVLMGVIIQEMVDPELSGVLLTRNPVTYAGEIIIEAVEGLGDVLMQKGSDAIRWVIKDGEFIDDQLIPEEHHPLVEKLTADAKMVRKRLKKDVDIEWVFDGKDVFYVQCRPISSLSNIKIYSNRISKDMLPGMIKPLVWSVNIPLVNSVWLEILEKIVGPLEIEPEDLAHAFFYRTYFNMGIFGEILKRFGMPPDSLEILMGLTKSSEKKSMRPGGAAFKYLPRILGFAISQLFISRNIKRNIGRIELLLKNIEIEKIQLQSAEKIFSEIETLKEIVKEVAFFNIVTPLLMGFHDRMLKRHLKRMDVEYLSFDLLKNFPEIDDYDPNHSLHLLNQMFKKLPIEIKHSILDNPDYQGSTEDEELFEFIHALDQFFSNFGHFSDSGNDFSYVPWRENKSFVIKMIANFESSSQEISKVSIGDLESNLFARSIFKYVYRQARKYRMLREKVSSNYIFGYGLFRYYFLALGDQLAEKQMLENPDDIFYLNETQVRQAFQKNEVKADYQELVDFHKKKMKAQADITAPEIIYGDNEPILDLKAESEFSGVPASAGFYRGKVCVVKGTDDFEKLSNGDVLIIPFSDVGWTPLFPKAGAVISESGGMLSHCAIIAREYGIPSIVSANGVMGLKDGQRVTVDANAGILYVEKD